VFYVIYVFVLSSIKVCSFVQKKLFLLFHKFSSPSFFCSYIFCSWYINFVPGIQILFLRACLVPFLKSSFVLPSYYFLFLTIYRFVPKFLFANLYNFCS
jgi:hypothetical protein